MLDAGVVDQDVHCAEALGCCCNQRFDLTRFGHVGTVVIDRHAGGGDVFFHGVDLLRITEAVEHDVRALRGECARDAEADARGGASDEGGFSVKHDGTLKDR